jgi:hypothetical protein
MERMTIRDLSQLRSYGDAPSLVAALTHLDVSFLAKT